MNWGSMVHIWVPMDLPSGPTCFPTKCPKDGASGGGPYAEGKNGPEGQGAECHHEIKKTKLREKTHLFIAF